MTDNEQAFQGQWISALRKEGFTVQKFQDSLQKGIPDLLLGRSGIGLWTEVKFVETPKRASTRWPIHWQSGQQSWLSTWWGRPLPTCVLIGCANENWLLVPGNQLKTLDAPHSSFPLYSEISSRELLRAMREFRPPGSSGTR